MSKSSRISLYSSDALTEKGLFLSALDAKSSISTPNVLELSGLTVNLAGQTTSANDVVDLGQKITDIVDLQATDNTARSAGIATNLTTISTIDAREASNHSAQGALLGAETARATTAETVNASAITAEETRALAAEAVNAAAVVSEANARATAITAEETRALAAEAVNAAAITALGNVDTTTLASINSMLAAYQAADNSISSLITALTTRVDDLEDQVDTLTA